MFTAAHSAMITRNRKNVPCRKGLPVCTPLKRSKSNSPKTVFRNVAAP